jgi:hypothetical protein
MKKKSMPLNDLCHHQIFRQLNIFDYCYRLHHKIVHPILFQVAIHAYNQNDHEEIYNYHQNHNNLNIGIKLNLN